MKMYYCGLNVFGQFLPVGMSASASLTINYFQEFYNSRDIQALSLSWRNIVLLIGSELHIRGFVDDKSNQDKILQVPENQKASKVAACRSHVLIITDAGDCWQYMCPSGPWRKIANILLTEQGQGAEKLDATTQLCDSEPADSSAQFLVKVCCGETFNVALSSAGQAYNIPSPLPLPGVKVTDVACGIEHGLLLTEEGCVFSFGTGSRGQLGLGDLVMSEEEPCEVAALSGLGVVCVAAGGWHSAAVTQSGDLYTWGWNCAGQLGFPGDMPEIGRVELADLGEGEGSKRPPALSCQHEASEEVSVLAVPTPVDWPPGIEAAVKKVACGTRHTVAMLDDGSVWGCGWNRYGQLGFAPSALPRCHHMTRLGGEHFKVTDIQCAAWSTVVTTDED